MHDMAHAPIAIGILLVLGTAAGCALIGSGHLGHTAVDPEREEAALPSGATSAADRLIIRGIEVYRQQYCGTCHCLDRAETGGTFGPGHNGFAMIAAQRIQSDDYTGRATTAAEYIRESVMDPNLYLVPGYASEWHQMPPYVHLNPEDLEALVQLLLSEE